MRNTKRILSRIVEKNSGEKKVRGRLWHLFLPLVLRRKEKKRKGGRVGRVGTRREKILYPFSAMEEEKGKKKGGERGRKENQKTLQDFLHKPLCRPKGR